MKNLKLFSMIAIVAILTACTNQDPTFIRFISAEEVSVALGKELNFDVKVRVANPKGETQFVFEGLPQWVTPTQNGNTVTLKGTVPSDFDSIPVRITAINNKEATEQNVLIRKGMVVIYSEDFGTTATGNPSVTAYNGYERGGLGGGVAVYAQEGGTVSIRTTSSSANGYPNASGACNAMMAGTGASLVIKDIATCGARNFKLSFGCNQSNDTIAVAYRVYNTTEWVSLPFSKETVVWGKVEGITFTLPEGTNTISLKFTAGRTGFGTRVDDIILGTFDATSEPIIEGTAPPIFYETFGNSGKTENPRDAIDAYTDYDNKSPVVFTGTTDVRATSSINTHVWFAATNPATRYLSISGINTAGVSNLKLSFDIAHSQASATPTVVVNNILTVKVKDLNTNIETPLTVPAISLGGQNVYSTVPDITDIPATSNLQITFTGTAQNTMGFRLDNVRIDGNR